MKVEKSVSALPFNFSSSSNIDSLLSTSTNSTLNNSTGSTLSENTSCLDTTPSAKRRRTAVGESGYDIKMELEEHEVGVTDLRMSNREEDGTYTQINFETRIKQEQVEEGEIKEAGEVGGDLDLLFRIKQEMDE